MQLGSSLGAVSFSSRWIDPVSIRAPASELAAARAAGGEELRRAVSGVENMMWDMNVQNPTKCQKMAPAANPSAAHLKCAGASRMASRNCPALVSHTLTSWRGVGPVRDLAVEPWRPSTRRGASGGKRGASLRSGANGMSAIWRNTFENHWASLQD